MYLVRDNVRNFTLVFVHEHMLTIDHDNLPIEKVGSLSSE